MNAPLLAARDLRLGAASAPTMDRVSFETRGERVLVLGTPRALFEAASGVLRPSAGSLDVRGVACERALAAGTIAGAPLDPPMPPDWSPLEYATWSARLVGHRRDDAKRRALAAFEALGVTDAAGRLGTAPPALRRATVLAATLATNADVVLLEDPCAGLDDSAAQAFGALAARALATMAKGWVLFAARAPLDWPLVRASDEALVFEGGRVASQGVPRALAAAARRYAIDVRGTRADNDALLARIAAHGRVRDATLGTDGARFVVELAEGATTRDLFACAAAGASVLVEVRPAWP